MFHSSHEVGIALPEPATDDAPTNQDLKQLGIYNAKALKAFGRRRNQQKWLVENLLLSQSFNVLVGDSGLGKTPLVLQLGLAVAGGSPSWHGYPIPTAGPVLYLNGEMDADDLTQQIEALSSHLGFAAPPDNFFMHHPDWAGKKQTDLTGGDRSLMDKVHASKARLVIVDPLRVFFPEAELDLKKFEELRSWARKIQTCVLLVHHRRKHDKVNGVYNLAGEPQSWLQEASGLGHLINLTDTRLGVDRPSVGADLLLCGFVRAHGVLSPVQLQRACDLDGQPVGYELRQGLRHTSQRAQDLFQGLPVSFAYKDVHTALQMGNSATTRVIDELLRAGVITKLENNQGYRKQST